MSDAHDHFRKVYLDEWTTELRAFKNRAEMKSDEKFHADLEKRIKKEDPLLYAVLAYELLYLGLQESKNIQLKAVVEGWIDKSSHSTRPLPVVLNLRRRDLFSEVRSILPFWLTMPFFRRLASIFRRKKKKDKRSSAPPPVRGPEPEAHQRSASRSRDNSRQAAYRRDLEKIKDKIQLQHSYD